MHQKKSERHLPLQRWYRFWPDLLKDLRTDGFGGHVHPISSYQTATWTSRLSRQSWHPRFRHPRRWKIWQHLSWFEPRGMYWGRSSGYIWLMLVCGSIHLLLRNVPTIILVRSKSVCIKSLKGFPCQSWPRFSGQTSKISLNVCYRYSFLPGLILTAVSPRNLVRTPSRTNT